MTGSLKDDFVGSNPTLRPERLAEDGDKALRPKGLDEFIGQEAARANLKVFIQSARQRGEAMESERPLQNGGMSLAGARIGYGQCSIEESPLSMGPSRSRSRQDAGARRR
mgnify:CR=1 FL=1